MPTHVYHPSRNPPRFIDRLLVHPFDNIIATLSILYGVLLLLAGFWGGEGPSPSFDQVPDWLAILVGAFATSGGVLALTGLHWSGNDVSRGWAFEKFGWILALAAFTSYVIAVLYVFPGSVLAWATPACLALGMGLRLVSLVLIERNERRQKARRE